MPYFFFSANSFAQNWKTITRNDTSYFSVWCPIGIDSDMHGYIRCAWIDQVTLMGGDSVFFFNKTIAGDSNSYICADTAASTFLGKMFTRNNLTGSETYFNLNQLPIEIKTWAHLNDSWNMITDTSGKAYYATVTNEYTMLIDGVTDSVKDVTIQAFFNGNPVSSVFNGTIMTLTKNHGFYNTLHLNIFPECFNNFSYISGFLQPEIVSPHRRIAQSIKNINFAQQDLSVKYKPGNEWIFETSIGQGKYLDMVGNYFGDIYTDHDSVISTNQINQNLMSYTFQRKRHHWHLLHLNNIDTNITFNTTALLTDTVYNTNAIVTLHTKLCSDILDVTHDTFPINSGSKMKVVYYFLDSVCNSPRLRRYDYGSRFSYSNNNDSCHKFTNSISGFTIVDTTTLFNFDFNTGKVVNYDFNNQLADNRYYKLLYLKTDSCTYQNKINVFVLSSKEVSEQNADLKLYPNPVSNTLYLMLPNDSDEKTVRIKDLTGQPVHTDLIDSNALDVGRLSSGLYIISVQTKNGLYTKTFMKN